MRHAHDADGPDRHHDGHRRGHADHHGHHHRHGRGRRHDRPFDHGELRLVILAMIAEQPRHGYELIKAIEERMAGTYSPSPGVIYPTLALLEELGHASVTESDAGRKLHAVTPEGQEFLEANRPAVDAAMSRMAAAGGGQPDGGASQAPVIRAMENLKLALRLRLAAGPLDAERIDTIATLIDAAARSVERS